MKIMIDKLNNKKLILYYEVFITVLTIIAVVMVALEYFTQETSYLITVFNMIDTGILIIFALDYFTRLILSEDKFKFFKSNMIDLISIIPFNSAFQTARLLRFTKLFKLVKLLRIFDLTRKI